MKDAKPMIRWYLDKESKVPLYLQLKDQIKYHISTGGLQDGQQLPAVNNLAKDLTINFETVRKAYKEMEKEGLISMQRAKGTLVTLHPSSAPANRHAVAADKAGLTSFTDLASRMLRLGQSATEIRKSFESGLESALAERNEQYIIFTECNPLQVQEISAQLKDILPITVQPVLLSELEDKLAGLDTGAGRLKAIVTTGFHLNDVRAALGNRSIDVQVLVTNMSPDSRRKIDELGPDKKFGFICRDRESIPLYQDLLKAEFGKKIKLASAHLGDDVLVESVLASADVLLVTPPVYKDMKKRAPARLQVFNVFDRIDPMSIRMLKSQLEATG
jgi:DNA-binding transcriptional regulator YhcF (GntR family)